MSKMMKRSYIGAVVEEEGAVSGWGDADRDLPVLPAVGACFLVGPIGAGTGDGLDINGFDLFFFHFSKCPAAQSSFLGRTCQKKL